MIDDPHVREPWQEPPLLPWTEDVRFEWPEPGDPEVEQLRRGLPEEGKGLFLLVPPYGTGKVLVEAYYPDEIEDHYAGGWIGKGQQEDLTYGRLVVIHIHEKIKPSMKPLNERHLSEIRRNARNLRSDLKRKSSSSNRKQELEGAIESEEAVVYDRFTEFWAEKVRETRKYAATPHVGPARSLSLGGGI